MTASKPAPVMAGSLSAVSLFSGTGGLDLGAHRAGVDVLVATDVMPDAAVSYQRLLPSIGEFRTAPIRNVGPLPQADVLLGGYPCQPFSMGGPRRPSGDKRSALFREFGAALSVVRPQVFVAENVPGLASLAGRNVLHEHLATFAAAGNGYRITYAVLKSEQYGVPQRRRRLFMVGVRRDLELFYHFPETTHSATDDGERKRLVSHGDAIGHLDQWPEGDFYEFEDPERNWPWYYMSRNRKARWDDPSYTVLANARHTSLHPGSPMMQLAWSQIDDGFKQGWEFTDDYEHLAERSDRIRLDRPRRLSWQECALIQTFPASFEPAGSLMRKVELIGNAVPPDLAEAVIEGIVSGEALRPEPPSRKGVELWLAPSDIRVPVAYGSNDKTIRRVMQANKAKESKPERLLRSELFKAGARYYKNYKVKLFARYVNVDIAAPGIKLAIFVDGCFWHCCPEHGHVPGTNFDYWGPKLKRNVARDAAINAELGSMGWTVIRVWEHEGPRAAAARIMPLYRHLRDM